MKSPLSSCTTRKLRGLCGIIAILVLLLAHPSAATPPEGRALRIFDGSERVIGYRTSSHAGSIQLQELIRMVPGGEKITVKALRLMPEKSETNMGAAYPVMVRRMNNNFSPTYRIEGPNDEANIAKGIKELTRAMEIDLQAGHNAVFYHAGHYNENNSHDEARFILNSGLAFRAMTAMNKDPRFAFLDTVTPTHKHFPATVRSDGFHANAAANYLEGLEVVKAMCRHDGIEFPKAVEDFVLGKVAEASRTAEIIDVTYPDHSVPFDTTLRVGDKVTIHFQVHQPAAESDKVASVYVLLHSVFLADYYISEKIPVGPDGKGSFTWVVGRDLKEIKFSPGKFKSPEDAPLKTLTNRKSGEQRYCFRVMHGDLSKARLVYNFSSRFRVDFDSPPVAQPKTFDVEP